VQIVFEVSEKEHEGNFTYLAIADAQEGFKFSGYDPSAWPCPITIDLLEAGRSFKGYLVSDYCRTVSVHTLNDYEMLVHTGGNDRAVVKIQRLVEAATMVALAGAVASVAATALGIL
jgi:hypothetical protein